jgi:hypothetical protein
MTTLPVIFILDLDRTLIGDPAHILDYYNTLQFIKDARLSKKITPEELSDAEFKALPNWKDLFVPEFFRPHLKESLETLRKYFPTAEFFIYSAGLPDYVKQMVDIVEKHIGFRFNRPLFSRTECPTDETNQYSKSIVARFPKIIQSLSQLERYSGLNLEEYTETLMDTAVLFLDDTDFVWDRKEKWIKCPPYNYKPMFDIDDKILRLIHRIPLIQEYLRSSQANQTLYIHENPSFSYDEYRMNYHLFMANLYRDHTNANRTAYTKDDFLPRLVKALQPYKNKSKPFNTRNLLAIKKTLGIPSV